MIKLERERERNLFMRSREKFIYFVSRTGEKTSGMGGKSHGQIATLVSISSQNTFLLPLSILLPPSSNFGRGQMIPWEAERNRGAK